MSAAPLPLTDERYRSIECAVADFTSVARGKIVSRSDFESARGCRRAVGRCSA